MTNTRVCFIFIFILAFSVLLGCYDITGTLTTETGNPITGAALSLSGSEDRTTTTDQDGRYAFKSVPGGSYTVQASLADYQFEPQRAEINLTGNITLNFIGNFHFEEIQYGHPLTPENPKAIIVTSETLRDAYLKYAVLHTATGIDTEVVTVEDVCAGTCDDTDQDIVNDTPVVLKKYIMSLPGLEYLIIGGDVDVVPTVYITNSYEWSLVYLGYHITDITENSTEQTIMTDYYYADFSEWDSNGDGIYLDDGKDEQSDMRSAISVSRIPLSDIPEINAYYDKVVTHMTAFQTSHIKKLLLQSGLYDTYRFLGQDLGLQRSWYYYSEGRALDIIRENSDFQITEQYRPAEKTPNPDAEPYTAAAHLAAIDAGQNIVYHGTHGSPQLLVNDAESSNTITIYDIDDMHNTTYPIILSTGCNNGNLAYVRGDTVAKAIVKQPNGGAIVFFGNTGMGSGLNGRMQYMDELLRGMFETACPTLADVVLDACNNLPEQDDFLFCFNELSPLLFNTTNQVVDAVSYRYTQASGLSLGDTLIPVWNRDVNQVSGIQMMRESIDDNTDRITIVNSPGIKTRPVLYGDGVYYGFDHPGLSYQVDVPKDIDIAVGFGPSDQYQCYFSTM